MGEHNDGGQAFPSPATEWTLEDGSKVFVQQGGMRLRDWFAGQALAGINANPELLQIFTSAEVGTGAHFERLARKCFEIADAMLAARQPDKAKEDQFYILKHRLSETNELLERYLAEEIIPDNERTELAVQVEYNREALSRQPKGGE